MCLIYRPNVEEEDRRIDICTAWKKIWKGFEIDDGNLVSVKIKYNKFQEVLRQ